MTIRSKLTLLAHTMIRSTTPQTTPFRGVATALNNRTTNNAVFSRRNTHHRCFLSTTTATNNQTNPSTTPSSTSTSSTTTQNNPLNNFNAALLSHYRQLSPAHFSDSPLDKAAHLRSSNPEELQKLLDHPHARTVVFSGGKVLLYETSKKTTQDDDGEKQKISLTLLSTNSSDSSTLMNGMIGTFGGSTVSQTTLPKEEESSISSSSTTAVEKVEEKVEEERIYLPVTFHPTEILSSFPDDLSLVNDPGFIFLGLQQQQQPTTTTTTTTTINKNNNNDGNSNNNNSNDDDDNNTPIPVFAVSLTSIDTTNTTSEPTTTTATTTTTNAMPAACCWVDVRTAGQHLTGGDAAVLASASGLLAWHRSAVFDSRSGNRAAPESAGHSRRAITTTEQKQEQSSSSSSSSSSIDTSGSGNNNDSDSSKRKKVGVARAYYPRVDPAVIVAVYCGDWMLLGRKKSWQFGRYSLLAGFTELGETLEQAAAREVYEESGIFLEDTTSTTGKSIPLYLGSQPWPFPSSLMLGFAAQASCVENKNTTTATANSSSNSNDDGSIKKKEDLLVSVEECTKRGFELLSHQGRQAALSVGIKAEEVHKILWPPLQTVHVDENELEDARWFHKDFLSTALSTSSSTSIDTSSSSPSSASSHSRYYPAKLWLDETSPQRAFRIPGSYALANRIINSWLKAAHDIDSNTTTNNTSSSTADDRVNSGDDDVLKFEQLIPEVAIDGEGVFKYVLLRVTCMLSNRSTLIVRGDSRAEYHNHILQNVKKECAAVEAASGGKFSLTVEPVGGGRMEHILSSYVSRVSVYGYSAAYGQAPHEVVAVMLRKWLPWHEVDVSYDGY